MSSLIPAANLAGLPALVLPCGFAANLPVVRVESRLNLRRPGGESRNQLDNVAQLFCG